jgi:hypothetical protein
VQRLVMGVPEELEGKGLHLGGFAAHAAVPATRKENGTAKHAKHAD